MSIDRLRVGSRSVLAIRVRRLELEISSVASSVICTKFHGPFTCMRLLRIAYLQRCLHQRGLVATEMVVRDMLDAILSSVHNSKNKSLMIQFQENPCVDQSSSDEEDRSYLHPQKAAPPEPKNWKARKRPVNGVSLDIGTSKIFMGPCQV